MDEATRGKLQNRLHRLEGQLRGIENMVYAERDLAEVVQQLWAVRGSVTAVVLSLIEAEEASPELLKRLLRSV